MKLRFRTPAGLLVRITDESDWIVFGDVFVGGEYDLALEALVALAPRSRRLEILDLGANVGYFAFRATDHLLRAALPDGFHLTLVEASPRLARRLRRRVAEEPVLRERTTVIEGLVGHTEGAGHLEQKVFHATSRVVSGKAAPSAVEVRYLDLRPYWDSVPEIDLLKCDVEGSELVFLETYGDYLPRVRLGVFEFHHDLCDIDLCRRILTHHGLQHRTTLRESRDTTLELFARGDALADGGC